jgi:hypothetical protein
MTTSATNPTTIKTTKMMTAIAQPSKPFWTEGVIREAVDGSKSNPGQSLGTLPVMN